jgi:hypothetical protein
MLSSLLLKLVMTADAVVTREETEMRTLRFHEYGAPLDVLRIDEAAPPMPDLVRSASPCRRAG